MRDSDVDITPISALVSQIEALNTQAKENNVLIVGITPGIINFLAQYKLTNTLIFNYILSRRKQNDTISALSLSKKTRLPGKRIFYSFNFAYQY